MTGCRAWMMLGLMVWRLVLAMARAVECLVRCCGGCRGFAQLREGSDDPPPPGEDGSVRLGGCDAQACQQAQQDGRHRQGATQTGNQMHETKTPSPNTKRNQHRMPIQSSACRKATHCSTPALHRIAGADGGSQPSSRHPPLFTLPPGPQTTHEMQMRGGRPKQQLLPSCLADRMGRQHVTAADRPIRSMPI